MKKTLLLITGLLLARGLFAANTGDEVIVVYNSSMPESKAVAQYYAQKRNVPTNQIFGFNLPNSDGISRAVFHDSLYKPLAEAVEKAKLWHIGSYFIDGTNGMPDHVDWRPLETKIRYAVLCYGVPLRIEEDDKLVEAAGEKMRPELRRNCAAVDSELALLPLVEHGYTITGPLPNELYTTTNAALLNPTNGLLMVARLDGPTPEIARGLVDKALEAERDGLWGRGYFDIRNTTESGLKAGDDWIRAAAGIARFVGFGVTMDTNAATFPASFPMDHIALYAGWYDGDASGPFSLPKVEFMPGAFAYHLQSFSAATLRSTTKCWAGPLLAKGATCTMGSVAEPYLQGTPDIGTFFGRFLPYGFTFGEAAYASQNALSWQTTVVGDPLYRPMGRTPQVVHGDLERRKSPLLEWSQLKIADLGQLHGASLGMTENYLEDLEATKHSAILTEKLAQTYAALGKTASTLRAYQQALALDPSPQQRIRLHLDLGNNQIAQGRYAEAIDNYRKLLSEAPDYPGKSAVEARVTELQGKISPSAGEK